MTSILTRNSSHTDILIFLRGLSAPCLSNLAISRCQLCVGLASSVRTFEKCPNKLPFFVYKVCRSLLFFVCSSIQFHQASSCSVYREAIRNLLEGLSWEPHPTIPCARLPLELICRLLKRLCVYPGCLLRRGIYWSFGGFTENSLIVKALWNV